MRKLVLALAGAAAMTMSAAPANAVVIFDDIDDLILALANTETFGAIFVDEGGAFNHQFDFVLTSEFVTNAQVSSVLLGGLDVDFTSIMLDGNAFTQTGFDPLNEVWVLDPAVTLTAGLHSIFVNGSVVDSNGSYVGNINTTAVPEPATWGMMLLGFAAVGYQMRKRRPKVQMQLA
jgi:hypothetical protein